MFDAGRESFGLVFLEAMACNKPIVTRADFVRKWIVGNAGILISNDDPKTYAKALERASEINWQKKPRKQAEKFSSEKTAKLYGNLFLSIVKKRNPNYA